MLEYLAGWRNPWRNWLASQQPGRPRPYAVVVPPTALHEQAALVALLHERPRGLKWAAITDLVLERGSAVAVREEIGGDALFDSAHSESELTRAVHHLESWAASGLMFWSILDQRYPSRVRDILEAPPFLFARGVVVPDDVAVSVVGSRDATERGLQMATSISEALVEMEVSVIAGLAAGVDTAAHTAALGRGGRTIAVIGTGINRTYPAANKDLQYRIQKEGLVLSQFWPDAPPQQHNFPMRNAVMSGYGVATVVVEAGEHSGARIQARVAVHHGRPVILTDLVARTTDWGQQLLDKPDVYVASSTQDVRDVVAQLVSRPSTVGEALAQLAV